MTFSNNIGVFFQIQKYDIPQPAPLPPKPAAIAQQPMVVSAPTTSIQQIKTPTLQQSPQLQQQPQVNISTVVPPIVKGEYFIDI